MSLATSMSPIYCSFMFLILEKRILLFFLFRRTLPGDLLFFKNLLEFFKVQHSISVFVMLIDYVFKLIFVNDLAHLCKCQLDVLLSNLARLICVKLTEGGSQTRLCQEVVNVNRRCKELAVIDLTIVVIVHLFDNFLHLLVALVKVHINK